MEMLFVQLVPMASIMAWSFFDIFDEKGHFWLKCLKMFIYT